MTFSTQFQQRSNRRALHRRQQTGDDTTGDDTGDVGGIVSGDSNGATSPSTTDTDTDTSTSAAPTDTTTTDNSTPTSSTDASSTQATTTTDTDTDTSTTASSTTTTDSPSSTTTTTDTTTTTTTDSSSTTTTTVSSVTTTTAAASSTTTSSTTVVSSSVTTAAPSSSATVTGATSFSSSSGAATVVVTESLTSTGSLSTSTAASSVSDSTSSSGGTSTGTVVGAVIGGLIGIIAVSSLIGYFFKKNKSNEEDHFFANEDFDGGFGAGLGGSRFNKSQFKRDSVAIPDGNDDNMSVTGYSQTGSNSGHSQWGSGRSQAPNLPGLQRGTTLNNPRPPSMLARHVLNTNSEGLNQYPPPPVPQIPGGYAMGGGGYGVTPNGYGGYPGGYQQPMPPQGYNPSLSRQQSQSSDYTIDPLNSRNPQQQMPNTYGNLTTVGEDEEEISMGGGMSGMRGWNRKVDNNNTESYYPSASGIERSGTPSDPNPQQIQMPRSNLQTFQYPNPNAPSHYPNNSIGNGTGMTLDFLGDGGGDGMEELSERQKRTLSIRNGSDRDGVDGLGHLRPGGGISEIRPDSVADSAYGGI